MQPAHSGRTTPVIDEGARLQEWMSRRDIKSIQIVSPHLDDAVFSLADFLSRTEFPSRTVFTVITRATDQRRDIDEYEHRRCEDENAMRRLRTSFVHCDVEENGLGEVAADGIVQKFLSEINSERSVVLLPLGAGGKLSFLSRLARRFSKTPFGCAAHGEHIWVRDHVRERLEATDISIGYYAEIPYQWANEIYQLERLAHSLIGPQFECFTLIPDSEAKLAIAKEYASQVEGEFGVRRSYQHRTASIYERIFLPAS